MSATDASENRLPASNKLAVAVVVVAGCLVAIIASGPRSAMGIFLQPMSDMHGWGREVFAFAIALQNLLWGFGQPIAGMLADKFGTARVLIAGSAVYIAGLVLMAHSGTPLELQLTAGLIVGFGISGSAFFLVLAAFARLLPDHWRGTAFGLGTAAGSAGQFLYAPIGQAILNAADFSMALYVMAAALLVVPLLTFFLRGKPATTPDLAGFDQTIRQAMAEAFGHPSYRWLVAGFFVCGFHVAFITVHLPAYIHDVCGNADWGTWAISLIGLFNIIGAMSSGILSGRMPKRWLLSSIYFLRTLAIVAFIAFPVTLTSILVFSAAMGLLWLSTVPPTSGLVAMMFGTRYMATLFGFVFISHQIGSFLGIWLGGVIYDKTGSYDMIWWVGIALGLFAGLAHLPIREVPVERPSLLRARA